MGFEEVVAFSGGFRAGLTGKKMPGKKSKKKGKKKKK